MQNETTLTLGSRRLFNMIENGVFNINQKIQIQHDCLSINDLRDVLNRLYNSFIQCQPIFQQLRCANMYELMRQFTISYATVGVILTDAFEAQTKQNMQKIKSVKVLPGGEAEQNQKTNLLAPSNKREIEEILRPSQLGGIHLHRENYRRGLEKNNKNGSKDQGGSDIPVQLQPDVDYSALAPIEPDEIKQFIELLRSKKDNFTHVDSKKTFQEILLYFKTTQEKAIEFLLKETSVTQKEDSAHGLLVLIEDLKKMRSDQEAGVHRLIQQTTEELISKRNQFNDYVLVELKKLQAKRVQKNLPKTVSTEAQTDPDPLQKTLLLAQIAQLKQMCAVFQERLLTLKEYEHSSSDALTAVASLQTKSELMKTQLATKDITIVLLKKNLKILKVRRNGIISHENTDNHELDLHSLELGLSSNLKLYSNLLYLNFNLNQVQDCLPESVQNRSNLMTNQSALGTKSKRGPSMMATQFQKNPQNGVLMLPNFKPYCKTKSTQTDSMISSPATSDNLDMLQEKSGSLPSKPIVNTDRVISGESSEVVSAFDTKMTDGFTSIRSSFLEVPLEPTCHDQHNKESPSIQSKQLEAGSKDGMNRQKGNVTCIISGCSTPVGPTVYKLNNLGNTLNQQAQLTLMSELVSVIIEPYQSNQIGHYMPANHSKNSCQSSSRNKWNQNTNDHTQQNTYRGNTEINGQLIDASNIINQKSKRKQHSQQRFNQKLVRQVKRQNRNQSDNIGLPDVFHSPLILPSVFKPHSSLPHSPTSEVVPSDGSPKRSIVDIFKNTLLNQRQSKQKQNRNQSGKVQLPILNSASQHSYARSQILSTHVDGSYKYQEKKRSAASMINGGPIKTEGHHKGFTSRKEESGQQHLTSQEQIMVKQLEATLTSPEKVLKLFSFLIQNTTGSLQQSGFSQKTVRNSSNYDSINQSQSGEQRKSNSHKTSKIHSEANHYPASFLHSSLRSSDSKQFPLVDLILKAMSISPRGSFQNGELHHPTCTSPNGKCSSGSCCAHLMKYRNSLLKIFDVMSMGMTNRIELKPHKSSFGDCHNSKSVHENKVDNQFSINKEELLQSFDARTSFLKDETEPNATNNKKILKRSMKFKKTSS